MRDLPTYTEHGKEYLLDLSRNIDHILLQEEVTDEKGKPLPQDAIDEKWKNKCRTEITRDLIKARDASVSGTETSAPITLLSDALNKLNHKDMIVKNIDPSDLNDALKRANHIKKRSEELKEEIYEKIKDSERN